MVFISRSQAEFLDGLLRAAVVVHVHLLATHPIGLVEVGLAVVQSLPIH